jgi:hypothetical protein
VKVALIGDVHANLPVLEAVLVHARQQGVDAVWNVGGFLDYGVFPHEGVIPISHLRARSRACGSSIAAVWAGLTMVSPTNPPFPVPP